VLDDVAAIKAIADPLRIRLALQMVDEPKTVKELAAALDVPVTRLYHHIRLLEARGFIRVAGRRMVSGIEERRYQAVAENWTVPDELAVSALRTSGLLAAVFAAARAEMEAVLAGATGDPDHEPALLAFGLVDLVLGPDDLATLHERLDDLLGAFEASRRPAGAAAGRRYRLFLAGYPAPEPARGAAQ
jgi:hypothetical protein